MFNDSINDSRLFKDSRKHSILFRESIKNSRLFKDSQVKFFSDFSNNNNKIKAVCNFCTHITKWNCKITVKKQYFPKLRLFVGMLKKEKKERKRKKKICFDSTTEIQYLDFSEELICKLLTYSYLCILNWGTGGEVKKWHTSVLK